MFSLLQLIFKSRFKMNLSNKPPSIRGYTMIELLVGTVMAFLIITPLMGFVINLLDDDRKEGVKAATDQELQTAMDYIKEDLRQAFYVYDRAGVQALNDAEGIQKENRTPILVFWKRELEEDSMPVAAEEDCSEGSDNEEGCNDTFVYSLVVYYVVNNPDNNPDNKWSQYAARIERLAVKDGVKDPFAPGEYVEGYDPSDGYQKFTLNKWDEWTKGAEDLGNPQPLIDNIHAESQDSSGATTDFAKNDEACQNLLEAKDINEAENSDPPSVYIPTSQLITKSLADSDDPDAGELVAADPGFSVCVNSEKRVVQVNLRGDAYARMGEDKQYTKSLQQYFPRANTVIQIGSGLYTKEE